MATVQKIQRPWIKKYNQEEKHDSFYNSTPWRKLRAFVLSEDPLCYYCKLTGIVTLATIGDHYLPRRLFPELSLIKENIKGCCDQHHQVKRNWEKTVSTREQCQDRLLLFIKSITHGKI